MNSGRTVFSQLIEFLPHQEFQKCVARYGGGRYLKNLSCWDQYLAMAFAQLTYRESLRDIEACLRSVGGKLYHMGFRGNVAHRINTHIPLSNDPLGPGVVNPGSACTPSGTPCNPSPYKRIRPQLTDIP